MLMNAVRTLRNVPAFKWGVFLCLLATMVPLAVDKVQTNSFSPLLLITCRDRNIKANNFGTSHIAGEFAEKDYAALQNLPSK